MSHILALLILLTVASPTIADDTPPFKITTKRDSDRVEVKFEKDKAIFVVRSPFGISNAVIERADESWPDTVVLRLHLSGLERFKASNGKATLEATVSSQDSKVRVWKDGNEDSPLNAKSPYWMPVRMIGSDGRRTLCIPLKGGYLELAMPKAFFEGNPKSITLNWIDFYRN